MAAGFFPQQVRNPAPGGSAVVNCPTVGAGLGASISQITFSAWSCSPFLLLDGTDHGGAPRTIQIQCQTGAMFPSGNALPTVQFQAWNGSTSVAGTQIFHCADTSVGVPCYDHTDHSGTRYKSGDEVHFLISADFIAQQLLVYANDELLVRTSGAWGSAVPSDNSAQQWELQINIGASAGDVWVAPTFIDLAVAANRRQFINADLSAVSLPSNGQVTIGGSAVHPTIFLHTTTAGTPAGFYANSGTGPAWALGSGTLVFPTLSDPTATNPCMSVTHGVAPPPSLAMDSVVAIDQTPALVAGSQVFLMWSDDRGHSYGSPVGQPIGQKGEYLTSAQWQRCGYARDRVWKLEWSVPTATALLGAYIELESAKS